MDESPTKQQVEDAKITLLRSHKMWLDRDPAGILLDLSSEDLRFANFNGSDLRNASFKGVNFYKAQMDSAKLAMADFKGAKLPARFAVPRPGGRG